MKSPFAVRMNILRQESKLSQREAARQLGISQALLSHYENGVREPKFEFVLLACEHYGVTADYLLGRTAERKAGAETLSADVREIIAMLEELRAKETALLEELAEMVNI